MTGLLVTYTELGRNSKAVTEVVTDSASNVSLVLVEKRVEIDSSEVSGRALKTVRSVVTRLTDSAIVEEVFIKLGLVDVTIVARARGRSEPVFWSMRGAAVQTLWYSLMAARMEIFRNSRAQERRLSTAKVVGSVCVENLAVVLDFEAEMLDHVLGEILTVVNEKTEGSHVTVPAIKLVEATTGNNEWQTSVVRFAFGSVLDSFHLESEQTGSFVQVTNILFIIGVLGEPHDIQVHIRVFASNAAVVLVLFGSSTRDVDARSRVVGPVFGVFSDLSNVGTINTAS
ncbi:trehalase-domain-containing protein, partial [Aureobasidium melanogenum]